MIKKIEESFLAIAKVTILVVMALGLIGAVGLAIAALYQYSQQPVEPAPAAKAPEGKIALDDLLKALEPKKEERDAGKAAKKAEAGEKPEAALAYMEEVTKLYRCSLEFAKKVGAEIEDAEGESARIEQLRRQIESVAKDPRTGGAYVTSAVDFACSALRDPKLIQLKLDGKVKTVLYPTLQFHYKKWIALQEEKAAFDKREEERISSGRMAENFRVALAKARALTFITAAGIAFGVFMLLALYLLGSKIESDLREMNASLGSTTPGRVEPR